MYKIVKPKTGTEINCLKKKISSESMVHGDNSGDITPRKSVILDLELKLEISPRAWLFSRCLWS